jgi:polyferredoxin
MLLICAAFAISISLRDPFRVDVVRDRASLARIVGDGWVENVYRLQIMNSAEHPQQYRVAVQGLQGAVLGAGSLAAVSLSAAEARWITLSVQVPFEVAQQVGPGAHPLDFLIERTAGPDEPKAVTLTEKSTFIVPR